MFSARKPRSPENVAPRQQPITVMVRSGIQGPVPKVSSSSTTPQEASRSSVAVKREAPVIMWLQARVEGTATMWMMSRSQRRSSRLWPKRSARMGVVKVTTTKTPIWISIVPSSSWKTPGLDRQCLRAASTPPSCGAPALPLNDAKPFVAHDRNNDCKCQPPNNRQGHETESEHVHALRPAADEHEQHDDGHEPAEITRCPAEARKLLARLRWHDVGQEGFIDRHGRKIEALRGHEGQRCLRQ
jgi:hypothetical protein